MTGHKFPRIPGIMLNRGKVRRTTAEVRGTTGDDTDRSSRENHFGTRGGSFYRIECIGKLRRNDSVVQVTGELDNFCSPRVSLRVLTSTICLRVFLMGFGAV